MTITLVLVTVTAYMDRNTNYNSSRDYLLMICLSTGLVVLFECFAHLRHRKRLPTGRAASERCCGEVATSGASEPGPVVQRACRRRDEPFVDELPDRLVSGHPARAGVTLRRKHDKPCGPARREGPLTSTTMTPHSR